MISYIKDSCCSCWPSRLNNNSAPFSEHTRDQLSIVDYSQDAPTTKAVSNFSGRNAKKHESQNTFILSLNLSDTSIIKFANGQLISININVNGRSFVKINGNNNDEKLSQSIKKLHEFSIAIVDLKGNKSSHTPDQRFQKNLIKVVNEGMLSFYKSSINPEEVHSHGKTNKKIFGDRVNYPNCMDFAQYLMYGIDDCDQLFWNLKFIDGIQDAPEFSHVVILDVKSSHVIHELIHIAHRICLNKIGNGSIFFTHFSQILMCYQLSSNSYRLAVSKQKFS
ncbi:hypothetical protein [Endozoicomonas atrinae]|uniref:hypothetical protein n=1 Tax=Endozoicomonas atrinae TaxID=1333660 RepID=UPI0008246C76|nr:hypothetical protein [Endozoicomonas atrinae]